MTDEQRELTTDEIAQANECVHAIHEAMQEHPGPVRFVALTRVLAAGIVAYGATPEEESGVLGAFIFDLVNEVSGLRGCRESAVEIA